MQIIDTLSEFDTARDTWWFLERHAGEYEYIDDHHIILFEDDADHQRWLEEASENGFLEKLRKEDEAKEKEKVHKNSFKD